jgi:hypothetical protein
MANFDEILAEIFNGRGLQKAQQVSPNLTNVFPRSENNLARSEVPAKLARALTYSPPLADPRSNPFAGGPPESSAEVVPVGDIEPPALEGVPPALADPYSFDPAALAAAFHATSGGKPGKPAPRHSGGGSGHKAKIDELKGERIPGQADTDKDSQIAGQRAKQGELAAAAKLLQDKADKEPGTGEMIGQLLVGLLPGLLGLAVGGAVGGTSGALAGAGGGFEGSAKGLDRTNQIKREEKDKLTARAQKMADRIDDLEKQIGIRKDRLEDRSLTQQEAAKQRNQMKELQNQRNKVEAELEAARQAHQTREHDKDLKMRGEEIAQRDLDSYRDLLRRLEAEAEKGGKSDKKVAELYTNASTALDQLDRLELAINGTIQGKPQFDKNGKRIKGRGNFETSLPFIGDAKAASDLTGGLQSYAEANAKVTDPEGVVHESDIVNTKNRVPMGAFTDSDVTLNSINEERKQIRQKLGERLKEFGQKVPMKAFEGAPVQNETPWTKGSAGSGDDPWSKGKPVQE